MEELSGVFKRVVSEERCLPRGLVPLLGCPFLGPLSGLPVLLGAGFAPGLVRYRGVGAIPAEAQFFGLTPFFLSKEPSSLLVLWGLVFQAEAHRQSPGRSYAERKAAAEGESTAME